MTWLASYRARRLDMFPRVSSDRNSYSLMQSFNLASPSQASRFAAVSSKHTDATWAISTPKKASSSSILNSCSLAMSADAAAEGGLAQLPQLIDATSCSVAEEVHS